MSNTRANILMLIASLIWGTAFVSQATGMGAIGPFTFSFGRFFFAFLTVIPFAIYLERPVSYTHLTLPTTPYV